MVEIRNRVNGQAVAATITPNILSCDELRPFWISWSGGIVRFGEGITPYENEILRLDGVTVPFSSIALATDMGTVGYWKFSTKHIIPPGN